ncbi:MAG: hypothetical protein JEY91_16605 [Spirochaetaceae bacterium]|nr:hypothetical protein [Spirochaetaceae bacterium]
MKQVESNIKYMEAFLEQERHREEGMRLGIPSRLENAKIKLKEIKAKEYLKTINGTLGLDPLYR